MKNKQQFIKLGKKDPQYYPRDIMNNRKLYEEEKESNTKLPPQNIHVRFMTSLNENKIINMSGNIRRRNILLK
jgi:hypothetical protein